VRLSHYVRLSQYIQNLIDAQSAVPAHRKRTITQNVQARERERERKRERKREKERERASERVHERERVRECARARVRGRKTCKQ